MENHSFMLNYVFAVVRFLVIPYNNILTAKHKRFIVVYTL